MTKKFLPAVSIEDGSLVIRISAEYLAHAAKTHHDYEAEDGDTLVTITDLNSFAKEVAAGLESESDDGTTLIHVMLDDAISNAIENGADGVEIREETYDDE